ncbi:MAG: hypothetical protein M1281_13140, partial [Chloroflexi bacterium]|nr:hypothetical protein [Chloroflexota bacterium]
LTGRAARARALTQRGPGMPAMPLPIENGRLAWEQEKDLALASVWHRHGLNHNHSFVLVAGTGLERGALATTYAHDSHNLVVLGRSVADMAAAANSLIASGGGYVAVADGQVRALAALPVAGVLAEKPVEALAGDFNAYAQAAADLGVVENPIGLLSSLPLPVVPSFRPTDLGLVDVERQELIEAFEVIQ